MKAVGIVGYKNSGKTELLVSLAQELVKRGHRVATVKHTHLGRLDLADKDTARHKQAVDQVVALAGQESVIFLQGQRELPEVLRFLAADLVLIEGLKEGKTYPRIVCLRPDDDAQELSAGLAICVVGKGTAGAIPLLQDTGEIADLVEKKAFLLAGVGCGKCGFQDCSGLAQAIVKGEKSPDDCAYSHSEISIYIDGQPLPLNPFASQMMRNTILGMLSSLKGAKQGRVEIILESEM